MFWFKKHLGFYVYCPTADKPRRIHSTKKEAIKEAKRLLEKHPYREFQILEITDVFDNYDNDEIPF